MQMWVIFEISVIERESLKFACNLKKEKGLKYQQKLSKKSVGW